MVAEWLPPVNAIIPARDHLSVADARFCPTTYLVSLFCSASAIVIGNTLPSKLQKLAGS
jgi:hypothetical protein